MTLPAAFPASLKNKLIVSVQAFPGDPLDHTETLRRIALSVLSAGAGGLRANGPEHIAAFRTATSLPIIGILKHFRQGQPLITPDFASARSVALAGADVIGVDCSSNRPTTLGPWPEMVHRIANELHTPVLADIATLPEALAAEQAGAAAVATTMYGYTPETAGRRSVDWELVAQLVKSLRIPVIVEGHLRSPEDVRKALDLGAFAVVVGAAITQPGWITTRFLEAIKN
ncbi:MAG: putative N-acetylmannosamine-6-phosphate 2-epimerase [Bacillota bacterium]|nr:putative N-acetylmannosamine-6-phosphate 2-epimerase [Bacillota bacterium]